jgi:hypothetical protein
MSEILDAIRSADLVVAVGSVDGVLTAAAVKRLAGKSDLEVVFTQAFEVGRLPRTWHGRRMIFVDLAVNNREPRMTLDFVYDLFAPGTGNVLLAVIDEHDASAWNKVFGEMASLTGEDLKSSLVIRPESQGGEGGPGSSGEVLRRALVADGVELDEHTAKLLEGAEVADQGHFGSSPMAWIVNKGTKSAIGDNSRRVHLVDHLAQETIPDDKIAGWVQEYGEMEANATHLLMMAIPNPEGIIRIDTGGRRIDVTAFLFEMYEKAKVVVLVGTSAYNPAAGRPLPVVTIATGDKSLDILAVVKAAGIPAGGFAQKVNIDPADESAAIAAVRAHLA